MPRRILIVAAFLVGCFAANAANPAFVAGSGYNPGVEGQPLVWANGSVEYFTDQGDLSPILDNAQANSFVATAFSAWTSISGTTLAVSWGGQLAEDVNGSNIQTNGFGVVTAPADITPEATGTPVGIVYDYDGTVTDAILGEGAGDLADCFTNAVYGGPNNFSAAGNIVHSLVVINGVCAATSSQLPDVQYRLVRVLGSTIGLGWSQANLNVITGNPPPTQADFAGFPVMHYIDPISCVPINLCYPNPAIPKMDDMDSLTKLYPPANNPQASGRIYGSVYFTDASGNAVQPMQGVNVVAELMVLGQPSTQYTVTSVSGFLFCGNAGNIINGYIAPNGLPYSQWGSSDQTLEGFFDLGELMIPTGQTIAQYQLTVTPLDPVWSLGVEPYAPYQVTPSGSFAPIVVTVTNGSNAEQDILMLQDEVAQQDPGTGSTYTNPAPLPQSGAWGSWNSPYGSVDYFQFTAQANRTASVSVFALDEAGQPTENKLQPVIGIWELSDQSGDPAPASTPSAFNTLTYGMTRLDAQFNDTEAYRVAVGDFRGDGRPDYSYQGSLLYSDSLMPPRLILNGGVTTLNGIGFSPGLQVTSNASNGTLLSAMSTQIQASIPPGTQDGLATIQVTNPVTGAFSQMIDALTYGASVSDLLLLLEGAEPSTPIGAQAPSPIRVRAVADDGVTPVNGATIAWSASNGLQFSVCGGANSCSVLSDEAGESSSWVTPTAGGQSTITIALAPESYSPPQTQFDTVLASSSALNLAAVAPTQWIAQGATLSVPLTIEALNQNGVPQPNITVNYTVTQGTASLSASSAVTNSLGFATVTANLTNLAFNVQVSACTVFQGTTICSSQPFALFSTPPSFWTLEPVSGSSQIVPVGQAFQPLVMRVTDGSTNDDPVMGVNVGFATMLARVSTGQGGPPGEGLGGQGGVPIILGSAQAQSATDQNGLASIVPSAGSVGPCDVFIMVTAGASTAQLEMQVVAAITGGQPATGHAPVPAPVVPRSRPHFGAPAEIASTIAAPFLAIPEIAPTSQPAPNLPASACSDSSVDRVSRDDASGNQQGLSLTSTPTSEGTVAPQCASQPPNTQEGMDKGKTDSTKMESQQSPKNGTQGENQGEKKVVPAQTPDPDATTNPAANAVSSIWFPEDKRSCRAFAEDGPIFLSGWIFR